MLDLSTPSTPRPVAAAAPVFLVGAERSGTTLVRLMLDHHPMIAFHPESEYMVDRVPDAGPLPDAAQYRAWLAATPHLGDNGLTMPDAAADYRALADGLLRQKQHRAGKPVVGATVHRHFDRLARVWPDARYIHLVRDPRDVARSVIAMGWAGNVYTGVANWVQVEQTWDRFSAGLPADRHTTLVYEDLIRQPQRALQQLCEFIGVGYDEAMFDYADGTTYDRPDPKLIEQWRGKLSAFGQRLVEARAGELLTRRGYQPSGQPPLRVGFCLRRCLMIHDRLVRARGRIGRYGLGLSAAEFIARRLGLHAWHRRAEARMHEVRRTHWK